MKKHTPHDNEMGLDAMIQNLEEALYKLRTETKKHHYLHVEVIAANIIKYAADASVYAARLEK